MLERILQFLHTLDNDWIYFFSAIFSFLENLIPPLPSDVVVAFCSFLLKKKSHYDIALLLIINTFMSTIGFWTLFHIGVKLRKKVLQLKFFHEKHLEKSHQWFKKMGYNLILVNRFFPGIRSVIGLYAGIMELDKKKLYLYSFLCALVWNIGLITLGQVLAHNKEHFIQNIGRFTLGGIAIGILWVIILNYIRNKNENKNSKL